MDRNPDGISIRRGFRGQARKSLWIETEIGLFDPYIDKGQARKSLWIETINLRGHFCIKWVRLVRACGSKHYTRGEEVKDTRVRLVRACGSKHVRLSFHGRALQVRLVRACGSKR